MVVLVGLGVVFLGCKALAIAVSGPGLLSIFPCLVRHRIGRVLNMLREIVLAFGGRIPFLQVRFTKFFGVSMGPAFLGQGYKRHNYFPRFLLIVSLDACSRCRMKESPSVCILLRVSSNRWP